MSKLGLLACGLPLLLVAGCGSSSGSTAATVNGHVISMAAYHKQVAYKRVTTETNDVTGVDVCHTQGYAPLCRQLKKTALNDLIAAELVRQYAASHGIRISDASFQQEWSAVFKQKFHANGLVLKAYARNLHLTSADIKALYRQNMLDNAVTARITTSMPVDVPALRLIRIVASSRKAMRDIQRRLKHTSFSQEVRFLTSIKSPACSAGCGEIPWVPIEMIAGYEQSLGNGKPGQVLGPYLNPTRTYDLYKVLARNSHYHLTPAQQFQERQVLFAKWLLRQEQKASIRRNVAT